MQDYDPFDLEGQAASAAQRKKQDEQRRKVFVEDLRWLMGGGPRGRRIVHFILSMCGVWRTSFTGNSETFFREGARNVGLALLHPITAHCPDDMALMLKEARENERNGSNGNNGDATD